MRLCSSRTSGSKPEAEQSVRPSSAEGFLRETATDQPLECSPGSGDPRRLGQVLPPVPEEELVRPVPVRPFVRGDELRSLQEAQCLVGSARAADAAPEPRDRDTDPLLATKQPQGAGATRASRLICHPSPLPSRFTGSCARRNSLRLVICHPHPRLRLQERPQRRDHREFVRDVHRRRRPHRYGGLPALDGDDPLQ